MKIEVQRDRRKILLKIYSDENILCGHISWVEASNKIGKINWLILIFGNVLIFIRTFPENMISRRYQLSS